jgi:hypothetical protein
MKRNRLFALVLMLSVAWSNPAWTAEGHQGHSMHEHHATPKKNLEEFQAKPSLSATIEARQPVDLTIEITGNKGQTVDHFDIVHEKVMHLIVVSRDLHFFDHIHPEYQGKGKFTVQTVLPAGGSYTYFCDYKPSGQPGQVSMFTLDAPGTAMPAPVKSTVRSQVLGDTLVTLHTNPAVIKANEETILGFTLQQATDQSPLADLQPYLGEMGHLVIIRETEPLAVADYIHTHALQTDKKSTIPFMAVFPKTGWYKLFGQFNRGGEIVTAPFWVRVD